MSELFLGVRITCPCCRSDMGTGEKAKVEARRKLEPLPALDLDVVAENNDTRMTVADKERC